MHKCSIAGIMLAVALGAGCEKKGEIKPLTDDQKKQIQEDDRKIADEESAGTYGKEKKKK